jgi:hypothetical protein
MEEDDAPKDSAVRTTVENIKSWIGIAVGAVAAMEFWGGIVGWGSFCDRCNSGCNYRCFPGRQILVRISATPWSSRFREA